MPIEQSLTLKNVLSQASDISGGQFKIQPLNGLSVELNRLIESSVKNPYLRVRLLQHGQSVEIIAEGTPIVRGLGKGGTLVTPSQTATYQEEFDSQFRTAQSLREAEQAKRDLVNQLLNELYTKDDPARLKISGSSLDSLYPYPQPNSIPSHEGALIEEGDETGLSLTIGKILVVNTSTDLTFPRLVDHVRRYFGSTSYDGVPSAHVIDLQNTPARRNLHIMVVELVQKYRIQISEHYRSMGYYEQSAPGRNCNIYYTTPHASHFYQLATAHDAYETIQKVIQAGYEISQALASIKLPL